jgi:hypothetical protein
MFDRAPETRPRGSLAAAVPCTVDGCGRSLYARGLCQLHYTRLRRRGSVGSVGGARAETAACCGFSGCARPHRAGGLCSLHYAQVAPEATAAAPEATGAC